MHTDDEGRFRSEFLLSQLGRWAGPHRAPFPNCSPHPLSWLSSLRASIEKQLCGGEVALLLGPASPFHTRAGGSSPLWGQSKALSASFHLLHPESSPALQVASLLLDSAHPLLCYFCRAYPGRSLSSFQASFSLFLWTAPSSLYIDYIRPSIGFFCRAWLPLHW